MTKQNKSQALGAFMFLLIVAPSLAKEDAPVVINGHLSGEINHKASEPDSTTSVANPATVGNPGTTKRQEVFWGYVTPSPRPVKTINRPTPTVAPWKYKPTNKRYQPRPQKDYRPKRHRVYTPKRSFEYHPKSGWSYTPRVWNRY